MRKTLTSIVAFVALLALPTIASADFGWGPRLGVTVDPDQPHFGAHFDLGYLADQLRFQPSFELGLDDDYTLAAFNFDVAYIFGYGSSGWSPYIGGGPGLFLVDTDFGDDTEAGLSMLGGIEHQLSSGNRFFTELRLGVMDAPDFKWTLGWTFMH